LRRVTAPPAISVKRLAMDRGGRRVLDDITFDVAAGEVVGLLGPNGAGKTTTLGVLATLLPYDAGEIEIAGHDLRTEKRAVRAAIGRVPQEIAVYPTLTARENAVFFARLAGLRGAAARRAAADAIEQVGLEQRADEPASTYSGGMQRRLNLACGLLGEPHEGAVLEGSRLDDLRLDPIERSIFVEELAVAHGLSRRGRRRALA